MDESGRIEPHAGDNPYAYPDTAAAAPPPPPAAGGETTYPIEFTATAGEYFRIWIVNLALTILTLGIYSAWAKVRKKRYFYGHTKIDGDPFEYRAKPIAILKGRIIAVLLFATYSFSGKISPILGAVSAIVLVFAVPWLMVRSFAFNARNSAYRNITFTFDGRYRELLKLVIGGGILVVVTLGFGYPYLKGRLARFVATHHSFGKTPFTLGSVTSSFYGVYFKAFGLAILGFATVGICAGFLGVFAKGRGPLSPGWFIFMLGIYLTYLLVYAYSHARSTNITFNALSIGPLAFTSKLGARKLAGIYVVNIVAVLCTLGLATPWAVVRTMRYRASKLTLIATGSLAGFVGAESANVSATGEEVGEMFDIDFGL